MEQATSSRAGFVPRSIQVGDWRVTALSDGFFRLDGGAMWGVVPAAIWRKLTPPDLDNAIRLALRPFLAERGEYKVLIEPGLGQRWDEKQRRIYKMEPTTTLQESLRAAGLECADITHVVASHCHWDHLGAATIEQSGALAPLFPNARHFAPRIELKMAVRPGHARSAVIAPTMCSPSSAPVCGRLSTAASKSCPVLSPMCSAVTPMASA